MAKRTLDSVLGQPYLLFLKELEVSGILTAGVGLSVVLPLHGLPDSNDLRPRE